MTTSPTSAPAAAPPTGDFAVVTDQVARRYRDIRAVDGISCAIRRDAITGVLGRNGSGKTTLMRMIAGQEFASGGRVSVFGENPVENASVMRRMVFIREDQCYPDIRVHQAMSIVRDTFPNWNDDVADRLLADFDLPQRHKVQKLSRGMRSALGIVIGLAARAELTLFDEPVGGLDPVARQLFYDHLLADYAEFPRTFMVSTHLVDEIANLLEEVILIARGKLVVSGSADELRGSASLVSGPRKAVEAFAAQHRGTSVETVGNRARARIAGPIPAAQRAAAQAQGLAIEPMTLQQLLIQHYGVGAEAPDTTPEAVSA